ncbi:MAG: carboxypeptidase/penicillin-binding protein 1A [Gordonia sp.]|uniref:Penicillin-binding protein n=1 Tax=Gordonia rubripertincta TaxID=36822 RepID=A0ABT4MYS9_GORRU|nr:MULTISPECIES: penicillin-binding protein [Mycobacteriales]MBA4025100.1 carboxypeptidase/penicillin-binding protein 1A [Gordonia sp. (in: high G+C Gram-positive bacteria)]MCZ4552170.1 penicillin-binding protein [Gordonia rubripertincta]OZG31048.1 penicillin-binding protein [Williamsia sp. 1138]
MLLGCCLLAGILVAGLLFPLVGGVGFVSSRAASAVDNVESELVGGQVPEVSTMTDVNGDPIAFLYDQRRFQVGYNDISPEMIRAIISVEDRRFLEHDGVDWRGTIRALVTNQASGEVQQGASTLDQQYVKNYQLLVLARTDAERRAATETTAARKLREIRMARTLEQTLTAQAMSEKNLDAESAKQEAKKAIVTRYLNLVPFGNGAYGIEAAAGTYFGKPAKDLTVPEAAMLAGMVQSSSALNPYTNPEGVLERRNVVLDTMIANFPERAGEYVAAKDSPLGVLPSPRSLDQGCISAGDAGFFCDYALQFLAENGISRDQIARGGYLIRTTLDPQVQEATHNAVRTYASPDLTGVANVMNVIRPGTESHDILAMTSSRDYGLNRDIGQTMQPQPYSMVGNGAGSVFKIFTVAAAMERGLGAGSSLQVPSTFQARGMGSSGGVNGCPANTYCVRNDGNYPGSMSVTNALAQSPNTAFVKLLQDVGVGPTVDMAVRLGLRSYTNPGTSGFGEQSLADYIKENNLGSFTLGPTAVDALELSNVAATLASGGVWCPPNPIASITQPKRDSNGNRVLEADGRPGVVDVALERPACERVVEPGLANTLANAMSEDDRGAGTAAGAAGSTGWSLPMSGKTGTTEANRSSAFLGFTNNLAGATYVYNDSPTISELCSGPLRQCGYGNLYGGNEPARTWFSAMLPIADKFGPTALPPRDPAYVAGVGGKAVPSVVGLSAGEATARLEAEGFRVNQVSVGSGQASGTVVSSTPNGSAIPGSTVTISVSNGQAPLPPRRPAPPPATITVPGVGPIVIPLPG